MRESISNWQQLTSIEQEAIGSLLGPNAESIFNNDVIPAGRDTLLNIYYLMMSEKVAGDLWSRARSLRWAQGNQLGIETDDPEEFRTQLETSGNFLSDGRLTCYIKRVLWSLRQVH